MPNTRCAGYVCLQPVLDLAIRVGRAFVLTKMFRPGSDEECLDVTVCLLEVPEDAPPECAIAAPNAAVIFQRAEEFRCAIGVHPVLDRDEHGTLVKLG